MQRTSGEPEACQLPEETLAPHLAKNLNDINECSNLTAVAVETLNDETQQASDLVGCGVLTPETELVRWQDLKSRHVVL